MSDNIPNSPQKSTLSTPPQESCQETDKKNLTETKSSSLVGLNQRLFKSTLGKCLLASSVFVCAIPIAYQFISTQTISRELQARGIESNEYESELVMLCDEKNYSAENLEIIKLLLKAGVDVNTVDKDGSTPLTIAASYGNTELIKMLIETGADVNKENVDKDITPLTMAIISEGQEVVKLLIEAGADVNKVDKEGLSPLFYAEKTENAEIIQLIKNAIEGYTALHIASTEGNIEKVKQLIKSGVDVNMATKSGLTPLRLATINRHTEIVKTLIEVGADSNKADKHGNTPLLAAVFRKENFEIVKLLIDAGADVNKESVEGKTPLHAAAYHKNAGMSVIGFYNEKGEFISITKQIDIQDAETIRLLLASGADINKQDNKGNTPLHFAIQRGCVDIVKILVEAGADVNKAADNKYGTTPLVFASFNGLTEIAKLLIEAGADVNKADNDGVTPLSEASIKGHTEIVKLLIAAGADVNETDKYGWTPLKAASENGRAEIVELLKAAGAKE